MSGQEICDCLKSSKAYDADQTHGPETVEIKGPRWKASLTLKTRAKPIAALRTASAPARILVVPDKFKGTLSAAEACAAITKGWKLMRAQDQCDRLPMSDGGDGFGEVLGELFRARTHSVRTISAAHRSIRAPWWWAGGQKLADSFQRIQTVCGPQLGYPGRSARSQSLC